MRKIFICAMCAVLLLSLSACKEGSESDVSASVSSVTITTPDVAEPDEEPSVESSDISSETITTENEQVSTDSTTSSAETEQSTEPVDTSVAESTSSTEITEDTTSVTSAAVSEITSTVTEIAEPVEPEPEPETSAMTQQYEEQLDELNEKFADISKIKTLPAVYITNYNNERPRSKEEYTQSIIDIINCDEEYRLTASGGVRVRGNSTADGSEKPYRIKFDKKQNMLGLHSGEKFKSWVLLRSQWNLVMDYTGFSLAKEIFNGEYYSSDCRFVNLYINGRDLGIYLLCEQNQATKGRVEVYEPKKDEHGVDIGYFIEIDNYADEGDNPYFTLDYLGAEFTDIEGKTQVFSPDDIAIKSDINNDQQRDFIKKYMDGVFMIMFEAVENNTLYMFDDDYNVISADGVYSTPKEAVEAVIDLDSMVNTMILQELVHNYDVGAGSFFMAVDFSKDSKYERLTFLAPWDFNWGYSEEPHGRYYAGAFQKPVHDMYDRSNAWLTVIMKAEWFREMLKDKWAEMDNGADLNDTLKDVQSAAAELENDLGDNSWKIDSANDVIKFVRGRIKWLNIVWSR